MYEGRRSKEIKSLIEELLPQEDEMTKNEIVQQVSTYKPIEGKIKSPIGQALLKAVKV